MLLHELCPSQRLRQRGSDFEESSSQNRFASDQDQVVSGADFEEIGLDRSPQQALGAIAVNCIPQAARCSNPNPNSLLRMIYHHQHNKRVSKRLSQPPHPLEIG